MLYPFLLLPLLAAARPSSPPTTTVATSNPSHRHPHLWTVHPDPHLPSPPPSTLFSSHPECADAIHHGTFGDARYSQFIYSLSDICLNAIDAASGSLAHHPATEALSHLGSSVAFPKVGIKRPDLDDQEGVLVWIGHSGYDDQQERGTQLEADTNETTTLVEDAITLIRNRVTHPDTLQLLSSFASSETSTQFDQASNFLGSISQAIFSSSGNRRPSDQPARPRTYEFDVVSRSDRSFIAFVHPNILPVLDTLLPRAFVPVVIPAQGAPASAIGSVPQERVDYIANITTHLKFSPKIDKITSTLSLSSIESDVRYLSGEDPSSPLISRHSFHPDTLKAAEWLKGQVEDTGAICHYMRFLPGFAPNVVCEYPIVKRVESIGEEDEGLVLFSGHYDSRGSFGFTRAPGADDDGSGSASILAIARAIGQNSVQFKRKVILAFFAGEEQGLLGSHSLASKLHAANTTVLLHVQSDMLAYHDPNEPLQLALPASIGLAEAGWLMGNVSTLYAPELVVGTTEACCSDHQSFVAFGFPATQVFERNGPIIDPKYHNSGDLSDRIGYDFTQLQSITKVSLATLLEVAGF